MNSSNSPFPKIPLLNTRWSDQNDRRKLDDPGQFLLRAERGSQGVSLEITAGSTGKLWDRILDAGWPLAEVRVAIADHSANLSEHWVFGGKSSEPASGVVCFDHSNFFLPRYEISIFGASDSLVWLAVKPLNLSIFDVLHSPLGAGLSRVVQSYGQLFFIVSKSDWKPVFLGEVFEQIMGLERAKLAKDPELWWSDTLDEDWGKVQEMKKALEWDGFWSGIIRRRNPDGTFRQLEWHISEIPTPDNGPELLLGIIGDATQFAQLKDQVSLLHKDLAQSRNQRIDQLLRGIENSKEGFALTDAQGCFTYMNAEHLKMFGYNDLSEIIGRPWSILYHQEEIDMLGREAVPQLEHNGYWTGVCTAKRRDGTTFSEDLTLSMLPDGSYCCNCRDRTEEIDMIERVITSEQTFYELAEHMPTPLVIRDRNDVYTFVNAAARELYSDFLAEPIGRSAEEVTPSDIRPQIVRADSVVLKTKKVYNYELLRKKDAEDIIYSITIFPILNSQNEVTSLCSMSTNITAQKRFEHETKLALEEKRDLLAMQKEFISLVSHEFRTPLSAMQGAQYLLKRNLETHEKDKIARFLAIQSESIDTLRDLVDQVLELNRIENTIGEVELSRVRPAVLVQGIVEKINDVISSPRIILKMGIPDEYETLLNPEIYRGALENLISNALKYSPHDSMVTVELGRNASSFVTKVVDQGRGIPAQEQYKTFQTFFRASNVGIISGTGLGLAIVKRAAEAHNGSVSFTSRVNEGSTFQITLPGEMMP